MNEFDRLKQSINFELLSSVQKLFGQAWNQLDTSDVDLICQAAVRLAKLEAMSASGLEVDARMELVVRATVKNWETVGKLGLTSFQNTFWRGVQAAAEESMAVVARIAADALKEQING